MPEASSDGKIRFGAFEVDARNGELRKHGIRIKLQEQPFIVLLCLLEKPGELVSRDELRQRIWGEGTFVDFDHGLSAAVNRLREALGDSADHPRYVETMARRGYRFVAAVEGVHAQPATAPPAAKPRRRVLWPVLAALIVTIAGVSLWRAILWAPLPPMRVVQLTTYPGIETWPAFSPDGRQIAFAWNGEQQDNTDVYVRVLGASTPLRLTSHPGWDGAPRWSPDGNQIAFVREHGGKASIHVVSPIGGSERKLTDSRPGAIDWSPDGQWLAIVDRDDEGKRGLFLFHVGRGERRRLAASDGSFNSPAFSPDGRFLAYSLCAAQYSCDVYSLQLGPGMAPKGAPRRLTHEGVSIIGLAWTADGESIVYSASHNAGLNHHLWRVGASGSKPPEKIELAGDQAGRPEIARHGNRLAFARGRTDSDIWLWVVGARPRPIISSTLREDSPQFSPDGTRIAFASSRSGEAQEIFVSNGDGSQPVQLTDRLGRHQGTPRWSPDGRLLVFDSQSLDGRFDVYTMDAAGGQPRRITSSPFHEVVPSFSRDGRWIYMASNQTGRYEIWRVPANGGAASQVTRNGGFVAFESWDGKTLFYLAEEQNSAVPSPLIARPLAGGPERKILEAVTHRAFVPVANGIYYLTREGTPAASVLKFFDFATQRSRLLFRLDQRPFWGLTVSPDQKRILFSQFQPLNSDILSIENFR